MGRKRLSLSCALCSSSSRFFPASLTTFCYPSSCFQCLGRRERKKSMAYTHPTTSYSSTGHAAGALRYNTLWLTPPMHQPAPPSPGGPSKLHFISPAPDLSAGDPLTHSLPSSNRNKKAHLSLLGLVKDLPAKQMLPSLPNAEMMGLKRSARTYRSHHRSQKSRRLCLHS